MESIDDLLVQRPPTSKRPLLGLTVLMVEDSRFACDVMRLLCLRSGARIRRTDSLLSARQHLRVYRPSVVIVDFGLPDGSGEELIRQLDNSSPRVEAIFGTSADPYLEDVAIAAGANGFLHKPFKNLSNFQETILAQLPKERQPREPRVITSEEVSPDPLALRNDFAHVAALLEGQDGKLRETIDYVENFLSGIARAASDPVLGEALCDVVEHDDGLDTAQAHKRLSEIVQDKLSGLAAI